MSEAKHAKVLTPKQQQMMLDHVSHLRHAERDRVTVLLSFRAGLRAMEISLLTWSMVTDAEGVVGSALSLPNRASKGKKGGRTISLHQDLRAALVELQRVRGVDAAPHRRVIFSERRESVSAHGLVEWFGKHYRTLGFEGASSHSGRRTFGTRIAKNISRVAGSIRDLQYLLGHTTLSETQKYVDNDPDAQRRLIDMM